MRPCRRILPALAIVPALAFSAPASASATSCAGADLKPNSGNIAEVRAATVCLINEQRAARGLAPVRENAKLRSVAARYSQLMVREGFFDHVSPAGTTMVQRVKRSDYLDGARGWALGENIAWGSGTRATPRQTVRMWMSSAAHRRNVLNGRFRHVGVGISLGAPVRLRASSVAATYTTEFGRRH